MAVETGVKCRFCALPVGGTHTIAPLGAPSGSRPLGLPPKAAGGSAEPFTGFPKRPPRDEDPRDKDPRDKDRASTS